MPQPTLGRPLHEPYLRHQLRLHPLHLPHLVTRHAAASVCGEVRVEIAGSLAAAELFASECKRYEFRRDAASSNWDDDELP